MRDSEFKSISIEGGDQVGKGDAVKNLAEEYCNKGIDTTVVSFPYYSSPIGYAIRRSLTEDGIFENLDIAKEAEVYIKMTLYALNRLEILNSMLSNPRDGVYIFDRGPSSNALTIAYSLIGQEEVPNIEDLVDRAIDLDTYFREVLNIDNCIIKLQSEGEKWVKSRREKEDLYENSDVQEKSKEIYSIFEYKIGDGWKNIVTRNRGVWRRRDEIAQDCESFASSRLGIYSKRYRKKRIPEYIGIDSIQKDTYIGSEVDLKMQNDWLEASKNNNKQEIYTLASKISAQIVGSFHYIKWYNEDIRNEIKRISKLNEEIFGDVLVILEYIYGEEFLIKFVDSYFD